MSDILASISDLVSSIFHVITSTLSTIYTITYDTFSSVFSLLYNVLSTGVHGVADLITSVFDLMSGAVGFVLGTSPLFPKNRKNSKPPHLQLCGTNGGGP